MIKQKILLLWIVLSIGTSATAQDTIQFPSQQEFRKYIFSRFDELQTVLFEETIKANLRAYKNKNGFADTLLYYTSEGVRVISDIHSYYISKSGKRTYYFYPNLLQGLCLEFAQNESLPSHIGLIDYSYYVRNGEKQTYNFGDTIFYMQSDTLAPLYWFKSKNVLKYLNSQDSSFIIKLIKNNQIGNSGLGSKNYYNSYFVNSLQNNFSYVIFLDSIFQEKLSLFINATPLVLNSLDVNVYDHQKNKLAPMDSLLAEEYLAAQKVVVLDEENSDEYDPVFKTIEVPLQLKWNAPHTFIVKDSQVVQYEMSTDTFYYYKNLPKDTSLHQCHFSIPKESINSSYTLNEFSWWMMDYYLWKMRDTKED